MEQERRQRGLGFVCVCVVMGFVVSGLYLYSGGPGYPWIHLGDWEACRRRKWESAYFTNVPLIPTMIKKNHTVRGNFRSLLSKACSSHGYILIGVFRVTALRIIFMIGINSRHIRGMVNDMHRLN